MPLFQTPSKAVSGLVVVHAQKEGNPPFGLGMMIIRAVVKVFMLSDETRHRSSTDRLVDSQVVLK